MDMSNYSKRLTRKSWITINLIVIVNSVVNLIYIQFVFLYNCKLELSFWDKYPHKTIYIRDI